MSSPQRWQHRWKVEEFEIYCAGKINRLDNRLNIEEERRGTWKGIFEDDSYTLWLHFLRWASIYFCVVVGIRFYRRMQSRTGLPDIIKAQASSTFLLATLVHGLHSHGPKVTAKLPRSHLCLEQEDEKGRNMEERSSNPYLQKENFPRNLHRLLLVLPWPKFCPKVSSCCKGYWEM